MVIVPCFFDFEQLVRIVEINLAVILLLELSKFSHKGLQL